MDIALYFLIGIVGMLIVVKLFSWPLKILVKLILNCVFGVLLLLLANFLGKYVGIVIPINAVTALIAGFLGVPGVIFLIIFRMLM
ncbi:pro-sigmaK processing inhibitor BofA family protein [Clostridium sp. CM028]|uniref:pro-sigmaK processing inhibitor BofA family protein n=1 Tax=unclassified Clostridium TaxID=2614128 RepID=UPI001C0DF778|nr:MULTISPECIES: pro-sigmaK processing inhibitor BofA family protein [unclassified Clostridium]MBU3093910.1 pro-sigmaK processing inhibitor BofA family protein [Clostridium sp. CF011]MBW9147326.1 pro-sigmaK processing inhibitor BofA family protein [Clostridium sp. CM027]MBW9150617.1 pro-sigmaK processing inhibitor BofA family protein [Clostridium sp. CM028]UVE39970.1 pro-sigmaK processing inhibitor BofA family protein [Clostridium sp. CM027]WAG68889.1 pro-sigmaK processing inhibitor BofA famil